LHLKVHLSVVLRHAKGTGIDAITAVKAARFQCRKHTSVFGALDRVCGTNQSTGRLDAVHADRRHRCGSLCSIKIIDVNHRITLMSPTLTTRCHTAQAADATLRIDEHCFVHAYLTSLRDEPFRFSPRIGSCLE